MEKQYKESHKMWLCWIEFLASDVVDVNVDVELHKVHILYICIIYIYIYIFTFERNVCLL